MEAEKENSLPWQEFSSDKKMLYLLDSAHLSDCCFKVGQGDNIKEFRCHKFLLIMASSVFERMFYGNFTEAKSSDPILITDTEPEHFYCFLKFIYDACQHSLRYPDDQSKEKEASTAAEVTVQDHGSCELLNDFMKYDVKTLANLIYLGKKYLIPKLQIVCNQALIKKVTNMAENVESIENVLSIFEFAVVNENEQLMLLCAKRIDDGESVNLYPDVFYCMDASLLTELLKFLKKTPVNSLLDFLKKYIEMQNLNTHNLDADNKNSDNENLNNIKNEEENFSNESNSFSINENFNKKSIEQAVELLKFTNQFDIDSEDENEWEELVKLFNQKVSLSDSVSNNEENSAKELEERAAKINSEIIQKLYEAINFSNVSPSEFCKLAELPELVKYLSDCRKFEILQSLCQN